MPDPGDFNDLFARVAKPFRKLLLHLVMGDTPAFLQLAKALAHTNDEVDPPRDSLPDAGGLPAGFPRE